MSSGKEVLRSIEQQEKQLADVVARRTAALQQFRSQAAERRDQERELIARIAQERLAAAAGAEALEALGETDREVAHIIAQRDEEAAGLDAQMSASQQRRAVCSAAYQAAAANHEAAAQAAGQAIESVLQTLSATAPQQTLMQAEAVASQRVQQAAAELQRVEPQHQACSALIGNDPLASYLQRRGYGSATYAGRGLAAWLDRRVASLSGFGGLRARQVLALALLQRAQARLAHASADEASARDAREANEDRAIRASHAQPLIEAEEQASSQLAQRLAELAQSESDVVAIQAQIDAIANRTDQRSQQALDALVTRLRGLDDAGLHRAVADTASGHDDRLAIELSRLREELQHLAAQADQAASDAQQARNDLAQVTQVLREFQARGFADTYSVFQGGLVMADLLQALRSGSLSSARFWDQIGSRHRIQRPSPKASWTSTGSSRSGSSFGGGGFRSGSSFGGGGFRSGKGF